MTKPANTSIEKTDKLPSLGRYFLTFPERDLPILKKLLEENTTSYLDQWGEHRIEIEGYKGSVKIQEIANKVFPPFEKIYIDPPRLAKRIYLIQIWDILMTFFEKNLEQANKNKELRNYSRFNPQRHPVLKILNPPIEELFNKSIPHPIKESFYFFTEKEFLKRWGKGKVEEILFVVEKKQTFYKASIKMMEEALLKDSFEHIAEGALDHGSSSS